MNDKQEIMEQDLEKVTGGECDAENCKDSLDTIKNEKRDSKNSVMPIIFASKELKGDV